MLKGFEKTLTKAAQQLDVAKNGKLPIIEEEKSEPVHSARKVIPQKQYHKQAAVLMRNCLRSVIRKHFKKMLGRLMLKRTCWRLITSKKRRDMEDAFLTLRNYNSRTLLNKLNGFFSNQPELKIMSAICTRIWSRPQRQVMERIRTASLRRGRIQQFCVVLESRCGEAVKKIGNRHFWNSLIEITVRQKHKTLATSQFLSVLRDQRIRVLRQSMSDMVESVNFKSCKDFMDEWNEKKQRIKTKQTSKKEAFTKVRQDIKKMKPLMDEQKHEKHKLYTQYKKRSTQIKKEITDALKEHEKEKKVQQADYDTIFEELENWERLLEGRKSISSKQQSSEKTCFSIYKLLVDQEDQFRGTEGILPPQLQEEVAEFKNSQNYFFLKNLQMEKLVEIYEKRQPYNYEEQYYDLQYENKVVRETLRCFVREKYEASINRTRKHLRSVSIASIASIKLSES